MFSSFCETIILALRDVEIADIPFFLVGCAVRTLLELSLYLVSGNNRARGAPYQKRYFSIFQVPNHWPLISWVAGVSPH